MRGILKVFFILFLLIIGVKLGFIKLIIGVILYLLIVWYLGNIFIMFMWVVGKLIFFFVFLSVVLKKELLVLLIVLFGKLIWFGWCLRWCVCLVSSNWSELL